MLNLKRTRLNLVLRFAMLMEKLTLSALITKIRYKLLLYPKIVKFLKKIRKWLYSLYNLKKISLSNTILSLIIRYVFFPLLNLILNKKKWRKTVIQQFTYSPQLKKIVKKSLGIKTSFIKNGTITAQIYNDLKVNLPTNLRIE